MRRLLVLDAALGGCTAGLVLNGVCVALERRCDRRSLGDLPAMARTVLSAPEGGPDAVAVTVGPGSFTGLRAALALAHGLSVGAGVPVLGVTVPEALAETAPVPPGSALWVALDTRRGRVFLARGDAVEVVALDALPRPPGPVVVAGDAADAVAEALAASGADATAHSSQGISAEAIGRAALRRREAGLPARAALPLYVEPPEARVAILRPAPA